MISGINMEVEFEGKIYHIQTEDGGAENPVIVTHLFYSGAIVSSRKTSYSDALSKEGLPEIVKGLMKEQHRSMIKDLFAGRYRQGSPSADQSKPSPEPSAQPQALPRSKNNSPSQDSQPQVIQKGQPISQPKTLERKGLDDLILDYLSSKESEEQGN